MGSSADRANYYVVLIGERLAADRAELVFKSGHLISFLSTFIKYIYIGEKCPPGHAYTFYSIPHSGTDFNNNPAPLCENYQKFGRVRLWISPEYQICVKCT